MYGEMWKKVRNKRPTKTPRIVKDDLKTSNRFGILSEATKERRNLIPNIPKSILKGTTNKAKNDDPLKHKKGIKFFPITYCKTFNGPTTRAQVAHSRLKDDHSKWDEQYCMTFCESEEPQHQQTVRSSSV